MWLIHSHQIPLSEADTIVAIVHTIVNDEKTKGQNYNLLTWLLSDWTQE